MNNEKEIERLTNIKTALQTIPPERLNPSILREVLDSHTMCLYHVINDLKKKQNKDDFVEFIIPDEDNELKTPSPEVRGEMKSDILGITGKGDMSDKPHMRALNPKFLLEIGQVFRFGQKKHGVDNFRLMTSEAAGELIDASMRHFLAYIGGEESASDSGLSHLAHLAANINMLYRIQSRSSYEEVIKVISGGDL